MKTKEEPKYITRAELKSKHGWTDSVILKFLGEPDKVCANPYYKVAPPMKLWLIEKVDAIMQSNEFKAMMQVVSVRKKIANKVVAKKGSDIINYVNSLKIVLPDITREELVKRACNSYNSRKSSFAYQRGDFDFERASEKSDSTFLNRICTNYLRHNCTRYEKELEKIFGKVGTNDAYVILKKRVNDAILEKFDFLEPVPEYSGGF